MRCRTDRIIHRVMKRSSAYFPRHHFLSLVSVSRTEINKLSIDFPSMERFRSSLRHWVIVHLYEWILKFIILSNVTNIFRKRLRLMSVFKCIVYLQRNRRSIDKKDSISPFTECSLVMTYLLHVHSYNIWRDKESNDHDFSEFRKRMHRIRTDDEKCINKLMRLAFVERCTFKND